MNVEKRHPLHPYNINYFINNVASKNLSGTSLNLLRVILSEFKNGDPDTPLLVSNGRLGEISGVKRETCRKHKERLQALGLILIDGKTWSQSVDSENLRYHTGEIQSIRLAPALLDLMLRARHECYKKLRGKNLRQWVDSNWCFQMPEAFENKLVVLKKRATEASKRYLHKTLGLVKKPIERVIPRHSKGSVDFNSSLRKDHLASLDQRADFSPEARSEFLNGVEDRVKRMLKLVGQDPSFGSSKMKPVLENYLESCRVRLIDRYRLSESSLQKVLSEGLSYGMTFT